MTATPTPPSWSRSLLRLAAARLRTPELLDDVDEVFREKLAGAGASKARRWYRAQAWAALWRCRPTVPGGFSLDAKLGLRMLRRYPGLSLVGGLAMAFAIFVGAVTFEFIRQTWPSPQLPLPGGERVIGLRFWDKALNRPLQPTWDDLTLWRTSASSLETIGAYITVARQAEVEAGQVRQEQIALMTPDGFVLAATAPLLGRVFTEEDVSIHGSGLAVIGFQTWRALFDGREDVIGQKVKVGRTWATVVAVMPEGFKFPLNHGFWMPLDRAGAGETPLRTFGRLRENVSLAQAQSELDALAHARPPRPDQPQVGPRIQYYRESLFDVPVTLLIRVLIQQLNFFAGLFVVLVAANIALLMYARAASRERELLVRVSLGASRGRIVTQFLVEAFMVFGIGTLVGLLSAGPGLAAVERRIGEMGGGTSPFWFVASISADTVLYALILMVLAVVLSGGLPALRATEQLSTARINGATSGIGRLHLGGVWSLVIVAQVAATVLFVAGASLMWRQAQRSGAVDAAFPASDYLSVRVAVDPAAPPEERSRRLRLFMEAARGLPTVQAITVADRLPLMTHGSFTATVDNRDHQVSVATVDSRFFDTFRVQTLAGRTLTDSDADRRVVVVDEAFARAALGTADAVGRRVEFPNDDGSGSPISAEIVGVVQSLERDVPGRLYLDDQARPFVYRPLSPSVLPAFLHLAVYAPSALGTLPVTLRTLAAEHDDVLMVQEVEPLDTVVRAEAAFWQLWAELILLTSLVALVLALAGIYAVMSFTVTRRTREIGIRLALGARNHTLIVDVLRGPIRQVITGLFLGSVTVVAMFSLVVGGVSLVDVLALALFGGAVAIICSLACAGPVRRALDVQPTTALASGD